MPGPVHSLKGPPENFGKSFSFLLTRCWLAGTLPGQWEPLSKSYFEHVKKRKADYVKAKQEYGALAVNERRVNW